MGTDKATIMADSPVGEATENTPFFGGAKAGAASQDLIKYCAFLMVCCLGFCTWIIMDDNSLDTDPQLMKYLVPVVGPATFISPLGIAAALSSSSMLRSIFWFLAVVVLVDHVVFLGYVGYMIYEQSQEFSSQTLPSLYLLEGFLVLFSFLWIMVARSAQKL